MRGEEVFFYRRLPEFSEIELSLISRFLCISWFDLFDFKPCGRGLRHESFDEAHDQDHPASAVSDIEYKELIHKVRRSIEVDWLTRMVGAGVSVSGVILHSRDS